MSRRGVPSAAGRVNRRDATCRRAAPSGIPRHPPGSGSLAWVRGALASCVTMLLLVGCAGSMVHVKDGYRHRKHDFRIGEPNGPGPAWERIHVDGAALAFQRAGPDTLTLLSR